MAIMLGVVLILCLWTRMGMGMDHRSAKGGLISNSSRIAIVGDCIAHYGALHTAGFARQLKHHLAHYHGGALVRSFYTPVNTATGLHGGLGDFYPSAFDTMMRDYQPTHVVAFFGTSDALAFLESHPDPTAMAGVGEGTLVRADLDVQRLVSGFKARLQNMAIRTHKEGAVLWLSTPSVLGEDVYSAPTPGQHLLELLAAAVRQVSEVMESPHFPHDMARHDQEEEKEKEEELRATQQAQGQGGKGSRGRKAAGKLSGARAKPPLRQVVEGVAAPAPRSALLDRCYIRDNVSEIAVLRMPSSNHKTPIPPQQPHGTHEGTGGRGSREPAEAPQARTHHRRRATEYVGA